MRIWCNYGYYKFYPQSKGDLRFFEAHIGQSLVKEGDYYTFEALAKLDNYTFAGWTIGNAVATVSYCGDKDELFKRNGVGYSVVLNAVVNRALLLSSARYSVGAFMTADNLIQAYNLARDYRVIVGFEGYYDINFKMFIIEQFFYEGE